MKDKTDYKKLFECSEQFLELVEKRYNAILGLARERGVDERSIQKVLSGVK